MMATQTQTIKRATAQAGRTHDYLYDTNYMLASERDHARATLKAHTSTDRVKRVPNYNTMFSELRHHPRFQLKLDVTDKVPKFVSRQWRGYQDQNREAVVRHQTFNYDPSVKVPAKDYGSQNVSGQNRYKFFRRPIIPFLQQVPPDVVLATDRQDPLALVAGAEGAQDRVPTPLHRTAFTQTDYRDSEAQTDPYTPEYVVRPGSQPELLTLATLSYGHGLPAGLAEVEMIERARAKRAWEATLPALSDTAQLDKRRRMMDGMERQEWALRESEIEKLQEARLEVLQTLLKQREEKHQDLNTKRLDRLWAKKQEEKENKVKKIRNEHIKAIRKLTKKKNAVEGRLERRDVVQDYSDFGSQSYAPLTRIGVFLDRGSEQFVVKSRYLNTYQGLLELEQSLPDFVVQPRIKAPKPRTVTKAGFVKRKFRQEQQLKEIHEVIKEKKDREVESPKALRFLQKIEKPVPRPATPGVETPSQEEEERELAVIFLQQIIRGRAVQNMMFEGKEKRKELIREVRSTHALQEAEQQVKKQEKQATVALQRQRRLHEHKESCVDEALSEQEGSSLGDMLDFLSKELVRLQEERRIHAFSMLAERRRRLLEAEESGRRQVEERRRREQDEVFKQVVKVHQQTVDTYLEDVILTSLEQTADRQARREIQQLAETINDVAYEAESRRTGLESEEIVSELVHGFLLPEVQRETAHQRVHQQQRKHLLAAHKEIFRESETVIDKFPKALNSSKPAESQNVAEQVFGKSSPSAQSPKGSRAGTPDQSMRGSRQPTPAQSPKGSRQDSPAQSVHGSRTGTPTQSKQGSRTGTPALSVQGSGQGTPAQSPKGSGQGTPAQSPKGSGQGTPAQSPKGSRTGTPALSVQGSGQGTPAQSPKGSGQGTPAQSPKGSRTGTPALSVQGSRQGTPTLSVQGSRTESPAASRSGTPSRSARGSRAGSPDQPKQSPSGSRTATPDQS